MSDPVPLQAVVKKGFFKSIHDAIRTALKWLEAWTQFLDDPKGKFSYKRGSGVVALVTSIIFAFKGDVTLALLYFAGAVAIAIVCGLTKT
jgi:hypothetical protein